MGPPASSFFVGDDLGTDEWAIGHSPDAQGVGDCVVRLAAYFATDESSVTRFAVRSCCFFFATCHQACLCGDDFERWKRFFFVFSFVEVPFANLF